MKKIVRYDPTSVVGKIVVGQGGALIRTWNHTDTANVSNTGMVLTSPVIAVGDNGVFETANSHYVPQTKSKE